MRETIYSHQSDFCRKKALKMIFALDFQGLKFTDLFFSFFFRSRSAGLKLHTDALNKEELALVKITSPPVEVNTGFPPP